MPVEIKELVIRAVVAPPEGAPGARAAAQAGDNMAAAQEAVIEAAVKEVLRILRASKER